jgi:hypothetical protein
MRCPEARTPPWAPIATLSAGLPLSLAAGPVSLVGPQPGGGVAARNNAQEVNSDERSASGGDSQGMDGDPETGSGGEATTGALEESGAGTGPWNPEELIGSSMLAGLLMAGGVMIIVFILMGRLRRNQRAAAATADLTTAERVAAIRARAGEKNNIDAFKADVHDFTRQMAALLDSKAERLELLIADADERLGRLERSDRAPDGVPGPAGGTTGGGPDTGAETPLPLPPLPAAPAQPARRPLPDLDAPVSVDPMHDRVYRLADSGLDAIAIARETGQPTGQVELILALRG